MWNPFKAIGNAIGGAIDRVFGREESAPQPERQVEERQPEPVQEQEAERRGGLAGLWDRVTGADQRRDEIAERERQIEERERQIEERQRQIEERERQIEERERTIAAPTQPPSEPVVPAQPPPEPAQVSTPDRELPKFGGGDTSDFLVQDERAFGTDSEIERELQGTVDDFIMDRGGLDGLSVDAREWLQSPTISEPFSSYWQSGGFSADQVLAGMTDIRNIRIEEGDDGEIHIEFDYDSEVDGYEVSGHASS